MLSSHPDRPVQTEVTPASLVAGAAGYTLALVVTGIAGLVSMRIALDYLGVLQYSLLLLAGTISGWGVVGNLGLGNAVRQRMTHLLARGQVEDAARCLSSGVVTLALIAVGLLAAFLMVHALGLTSYLLKGEGLDPIRSTRLLLLGVVLFLIKFPFNPLGAAVLARNQLVAHNVFTIIMQITRPLVLWLTLTQTRSLEIVLIVQNIHLWLDLALRYGFVLKQLPELRIRIALASRAIARSLLIPSISFLVISLGMVVIYSTGNAVIGGVIGVEFIAGYAAAFRIFSLLRQTCVSGIEVLFPAAAILDAQDQQQRLRQLVLVTSRFALALAVLGGAGLAYLAGPVIAVWLGDELIHPPTASTLLALGALLPVGVFINSMGRAVTGVGRHHRQAGIFALEIVLNLGLSIYLARGHGVLGVALGTLIARALVTLLYAADAVHTLGLRPAAVLRHTVLPAALIALPLALAGELLPVPVDVELKALAAIVAGYAVVCAAVMWIIMPHAIRQRLIRKLRR